MKQVNMYVRAVKLLSLIPMILGCLVASNPLTLPSKVEPYTKPISAVYVDQSVVPQVLVICVIEESNLSNWPVGQIKEIWNSNGRNVFGTTDCDAWVYLDIRPLVGDWARTEFFYYNMIRVTLSSNVPLTVRQHVLCHEFGHVLGLAHERDTASCMSIEATSPVPTSADLEKVGGKKWNWLDVTKSVVVDSG